MKIVSVALAATYSSVLSLQGLDTNGPIGFGVSVAETSSDGFILYGTVDAAAVDNTNAWNLGAFAGGLGNLPKGVAEQAATWPFLFVLRTSGSTAGSFFAAGNPAASPAAASVAAPIGTGYSALINLTAFGAKNVRIGGSAAMTTSDVFDVFVSNDATLASSTGAKRVARICGGGGNGSLANSALFSGYAYAIVQRVSGSTPGTIIATGVSPTSSSTVDASAVMYTANAQTIVDNAVPATVTTWTSIYNPGGAIVPASGVYTVPASVAPSTMFTISAEIQFAATAANLGAAFSLFVYVNGSGFAGYTFINPVAALAQTRCCPVAAMIPLNPGDTVDVRAQLTNAGGNIALTSAASMNRLSISPLA